ncbi:hypothetical protein H257_14477 [Aphanomyces astaci]|uniref:Uncharacterized protein n=1 Tax=Aphanomyces astaci TaxID=112090 RepID=W4FT75_APHAT|nr:hypothetical protein H257_14477 [Aphanomyces astaci]ETV69863.1 hypothetical protein H257_14477 [Aphanomyces astaci]|eukprot:XP_009840601.1 hypothetical protein H257_14477 [Aphanomyces astaci]
MFAGMGQSRQLNALQFHGFVGQLCRIFARALEEVEAVAAGIHHHTSRAVDSDSLCDGFNGRPSQADTGHAIAWDGPSSYPDAECKFSDHGELDALGKGSFALEAATSTESVYVWCWHYRYDHAEFQVTYEDGG